VCFGKKSLLILKGINSKDKMIMYLYDSLKDMAGGRYVDNTIKLQ